MGQRSGRRRNRISRLDRNERVVEESRLLTLAEPFRSQTIYVHTGVDLHDFAGHAPVRFKKS